jgi:membrane associated rhomboid family serine protease
MVYFVLLYFGAIIFATIPSMRRHHDNPNYTALGASGGVSAIVMAFILLFPTQELRFIIFPFVGIPAFIIGIFFFVYESYMDKRGGGRIAHDAHLFGALFCLLFFLLADYSVYPELFQKIKAFFASF